MAVAQRWCARARALSLLLIIAMQAFSASPPVAVASSGGDVAAGAVVPIDGVINRVTTAARNGLLAPSYAQGGNGAALLSAGGQQVAPERRRRLYTVADSLDPDGYIVSTAAGSGNNGYSDNSSPLFADFSSPTGVIYSNSTGYVFISDTNNNVLRAQSPMVGGVGPFGTFSGVLTIAGLIESGTTDGEALSW